MRVLNSLTVAISLMLPFAVYADGTPEEAALDEAEKVVEEQVGEPAAAKAAPAKSADVIQVVAEKPANTMEFYSSDKAAELTYEKTGSVLGLNNTRARAGFLITEERDNVLTGAVMYDVQPKFFPGFKLAFGSKVYAGLLGVENTDVVAFAANIEVGYQFPIKQFPLDLGASLGYAPDILTFGQSDRVIDWTVRAGLGLTDNIDGFVGLRFFEFDTRPGDRKLDQQAHIGIRWKLSN